MQCLMRTTVALPSDVVSRPIIVLLYGLTVGRQKYRTDRDFSRQPQTLIFHPTTSKSHTMAPATPRGPKQEYSPHKRTRIVVGWSMGQSPLYLHGKEGVATGSIHGIVSRYRVQKSACSRPRSGRPRILTESHMQRVLRLIDQNPFISAKEIYEKVRLPCSERTILRELIRLGIQHYKAIRRPKLTELHAEKRLLFARKYINKPLAW